MSRAWVPALAILVLAACAGAPPSPTASPTPAPRSPASGVGETSTDVQLDPGTWVSGTFRPRVRFALTQTVHAGYDVSTHLDLFFGGPKQLTFFSGLPGQPRAVLDRLRSLPGLVASVVAPASVGDLDGQAFEARLEVGETVLSPLGGYRLKVGNRLRVIAVTVRASTVLVLLQAPSSSFDDFVTEAGAVLETVEFP